MKPLGQDQARKRGSFSGYPESVVMEGRRVLLATGNPIQAARAVGVATCTLLRWNTRFGWVKLLRGPKGPRVSRLGELPRPPLDFQVKAWRCPCSRLNTGTQCETCGHRPAWAA